ncbi:MAG: GIY-YIG nuclease family protein [Planctomycetota bacterium]
MPQATRTALLAEERRRAEEGTSTVNALPEFNLNPQEEAEEEVNDSIATHQDMPSPDSGGHQTTERDGHLYIITHTRYEGWLTIGHSRSPNARRGGYNRSDPYRRYVTRHTVYVQDQRVAEMIAHAAASAHGSCEEARGEWFRMDLDAAIAILNQLGTPPENGD